jgi:tetratricopeptide (TPR) repeat protein
MERLLLRLETRPHGVDLLAGLVHSLRYCGLLDESLAAHRAARAIDPSAQTSVAYTHFLKGEFEESLKAGTESDLYVHALARVVLGREEEARRALGSRAGGLPASMQMFVEPLRLLVSGDLEAATDAAARLYRDFPDAEGRYFFARQAARVGRTEQALEFLNEAAVEFAAFPEPGVDPWLASIDRSEPYARLLAQVSERREGFRARFNEIRGGRPF